MPDQGSRSTAGLLQLPCRALGSLEDDEPHRKCIRDGSPSDSTDKRFVVVNDRQADGVQAGHRRIKNLATAKRHKSLAEDCRRCQIQRRHRGPRSAGKPCRLIAPRHLKSLIALEVEVSVEDAYVPLPELIRLVENRRWPAITATDRTALLLAPPIVRCTFDPSPVNAHTTMPIASPLGVDP